MAVFGYNRRTHYITSKKLYSVNDSISISMHLNIKALIS